MRNHRMAPQEVGAMTISVAVSPELRDRIDMLREHVETDCAEIWGTLASLVEVSDMFHAEVACLDECDQPLRESGFGELLDLFGLFALVLENAGGGELALQHAPRGQREPPGVVLGADGWSACRGTPPDDR